MDESEWEYHRTIEGLRVFVSKEGGGTIGRTYTGDWTVTVANGPVYEVDNEILTTGTPKTHAEVARMAADFASERIDGGE